MIWFAIAGVLIIVSVIFLIGSHSIMKKATAFEEDKCKSFGIVVGYDRKQQISAKNFTCDLKIRIPELSDKNVFLCLTNGVNPFDYPVGTKVDIYYTRSTGRIPVVRAQLVNALAKQSSLLKALKGTRLALLAISGIMIVVGIVTTIY